MINSVSSSSPLTEFSADGLPKPPVSDAKSATTQKAAPTPTPEADKSIRLVIEFDKERSLFVYRLIDRETGNVVTSIPRADVSSMADSPGYQAGGVVSTSA